jgi:hypothetical protein
MNAVQEPQGTAEAIRHRVSLAFDPAEAEHVGITLRYRTCGAFGDAIRPGSSALRLRRTCLLFRLREGEGRIGLSATENGVASQSAAAHDAARICGPRSRPLGLGFKGNRVTALKAGDQAEKNHVQIGMRILAVSADLYGLIPLLSSLSRFGCGPPMRCCIGQLEEV